ncbi:gastrula zinc finger protein XlCGF57.1-like isoform X3 [Mya arenaria]|uniref:gastrula zinc finger protein XlCGF57.1-like isoform X3 n=1 Tax=Mya arenaria TaxID=6604 RepID=UPI0022E14E00|nr:gastrula zinc finger protein XlCGF57.1-like isoform X3 [Mya arenaria]
MATFASKNMETYLLTLNVTLEQELAIRELFGYRKWDFIKGEEQVSGLPFRFMENGQLCNSDSSGRPSPNSSSCQELFKTNKVPNTDTNKSQTEHVIYNDLQEFVRKELEADLECSHGGNAEAIVNDTVIADIEDVSTDDYETETLIAEKTNTFIEDNPEPQKVSSETQKCKEKGGPYSCKECGHDFKYFGAFNTHKKNGKCVFTCEFCKKEFYSRNYSSYLTHLKYHKKKKLHQCSICDKSFVELHKLKLHMEIHEGTGKHQCNICGKKYNQSSNLLNHNHTSHGNRRKFAIHKCPICSAILSNAGNLKGHISVVHCGERPLTCEKCGKTFKTKKVLSVHLKVHEEIYPFACEVQGCGKAFKMEGYLQEHLKRHRNERTYFCDKCGKGFYRNKELAMHYRIHTGDKPCVCQICNYKCALPGNLLKHMGIHK